MKDHVLDWLARHPGIGLGGSSVAVSTHYWMDYVTDMAKMISAIVGMTIGILTLVAMYNKRRKNEDSSKNRHQP